MVRRPSKHPSGGVQGTPQAAPAARAPASDSALSAMLEALGDATLIVDATREVVAYNRAFAELWGLPEGWSRLAPPLERINLIVHEVADPAGFRAVIEEAYAEPARVIRDTVTLRDGRVLERYSAAFDAGEVRGGRLWRYREITEHARAEREFHVLKRVAETLNQEPAPERAIQRGVIMLATLIEATAAWLWVIEDDTKVRLVASHNAPHDLERVPLSPGPFCNCIEGLIGGQLSPLGSFVRCARLERLGLGGEDQGRHLSLPVRAGHQTAGVLNLVLPAQRRLQAGDVQLFQAVSNQFGIACERMRLFEAERTQRLAAETLSEAAHAISSTLDLPTVLQYIIDLAVALVGAEAAAISLLSPDGRQLKISHSWNLPPGLDHAVLPRGVGAMWSTIISGAPEWIDDYASFAASYGPAVEANISAVLSVRLVAGDSCLGALSVYRMRGSEPFAHRDLVVLDAIGRQAGIAIRHARHYETARRRAAELAALHTTMVEISSELDHDALLRAIVARAISLLRGASGELALYDEASDQLRVLICQGLEHDSAGACISLGEGAIGHVAATRRPLIIEDYATWEGRSPAFTRTRPQTVLAVPLLAGERLVGVFTVAEDRAKRSFDDEDIALLTLFAQQATIAIQNARRFGIAQELSSVDPLTGLTNRRHFFGLARTNCAQAARNHQTVAVLMLDIDHFKQINDTYGHPVGDVVLRAVAERCRHLCRQGDLIARYGGEEFIVLLAPTSDWIATHVARRLRDGIGAEPIAAGAHTLTLTLSIGVALAAGELIELDQLIAEADRALYQAKARGRNCVVIAGEAGA